MATKNVRISITPAVAGFLVPGATVEKKLQGIASAEQLCPMDRLILLFCLAGDRDPAVRSSAIAAFSSLPGEVCSAYLHQHECHPAIIDLIVRYHYTVPGVRELVDHHPQLSAGARDFLQRQGEGERFQGQDSKAAAGMPGLPEALQEEPGEEQDHWTGEECSEGEAVQEAEENFEQAGEEFLSKYQMAQMMGIPEKIKMALTGDKEWRAILVKDANKLVSGSVVKNPRITEGEILTILKVGVQNDEIIRLICANKEWVKNYKIRKALVDSPKTPLPNALRYLASLSEKDIAGYAKSRNISSVISTQAKRMLLSKKR